jgi:O-glycosyl hydrolase
VDYTALGHLSRFVAAGAYRIESNTFEQGSLADVAFRSPDGSIVPISLNGGAALTFNIGRRGKYASYKLESGAGCNLSLLRRRKGHSAARPG